MTGQPLRDHERARLWRDQGASSCAGLGLVTEEFDTLGLKASHFCGHAALPGNPNPLSGAGAKKARFCCATVETQRRAAGEVSSDYRAAPSSAACATAREGSTPRMLATRSDSLNGAVGALRCCLSLNASVATRSE
jgi:hypothetical protein